MEFLKNLQIHELQV